MVYFVFFSVRVVHYSEGQPLHSTSITANIHNISALHYDGFNSIWIGTEKRGIYCFDAAKKESRAISVPDELKEASVRSIAVDNQNRLWVGTSFSGLFIKSGEIWKHYEFGTRIFTIRVASNGDVFIATENYLTVYSPELDVWRDIDIYPADQNPNDIWQVADVTFDVSGNIWVGTSCHGIVRLNRNDSGNYTFSKLISAKRRFGHGSASNISPVPLDCCGEGLPSNLINTMLTSSDGTIWAGTKAGLAWSKDGGETWLFIRGRDYGDKIRGLLAGTPYNWKEISRVRFSELLPEDDISLLCEDANGILWIGTRTLGCIAIKPDAFYCETLPKSDAHETTIAFLEEMAKKSTRFYGTKSDRVVSMVPLPDGKMMLASSSDNLATMDSPDVSAVARNVSRIVRQESATLFPKEKTILKAKTSQDYNYPHACFTGGDYVTQQNWTERYGKICSSCFEILEAGHASVASRSGCSGAKPTAHTGSGIYALIGGGLMPHDKLISFDETLCKVRPFVGFVGEQTRPIERITLIQSHAQAHSHNHEAHAHNHDANGHNHEHNGVGEHNGEHAKHEEHESFHEHHESVSKNLTAWSSNGSTVPRTYDGQHLWCEVKLSKSGRYRLSLFFVDADIIANKNPRDYFVQILPEIPASLIHVSKGDWRDIGRRADAWAVEREPLATSRVTDFGNGVYQHFELAGAGTYYVKIDKNYSRKVDLCAVFIDCLDVETPTAMPEKTTEQTPDIIP
ncbi:MAG: hypothetical protein LBJ00_14725 [Planctomycetaceae bacterium]|nr:hypothetical protein [Planctomycetaceae bacterium]